jgi:hypothetical protein
LIVPINLFDPCLFLNVGRHERVNINHYEVTKIVTIAFGAKPVQRIGPTATMKATTRHYRTSCLAWHMQEHV